MSQKQRTLSASRSRSLQQVFLKLPPFRDDLYLRMQAMNIDVVDQILQDMESDLLALYIEEERTPGPQAVLVSALGQLWVFGVYELIRTWRTRAERIIAFAESLVGLPAKERERRFNEQKRRMDKAAAASDGLVSRWPLFERAAKKPEYVKQLQSRSRSVRNPVPPLERTPN